MQALQPMHTDLSKSTMPSGRVNIAEVGHAVTHGASAHWLHRVTWKARRACGNVPTSADLTYVRVTPSGTSFSDLHAVVHAWQPMQLVWSSTLTQRRGVPPTVISDTVFITRRLSRHRSQPVTALCRPFTRPGVDDATAGAPLKTGALTQRFYRRAGARHGGGTGAGGG